MKYIKRIDELLTNYTIYPYKLSLDGPRKEYTFTSRDGVDYLVEFKFWSDDNVWYRNFRTSRGYSLTNDNDVYNVLATVSEITVQFLRENDIKFLNIKHIPTDGERMSEKIPNKRSRINKFFLQKWLPDDYVYRMVGSVSKIHKRDI
jgi:hypothetical protein